MCGHMLGRLRRQDAEEQSPLLETRRRSQAVFAAEIFSQRAEQSPPASRVISWKKNLRVVMPRAALKSAGVASGSAAETCRPSLFVYTFRRRRTIGGRRLDPITPHCLISGTCEDTHRGGARCCRATLVLCKRFPTCKG